ncbi:MAG: efflux RND transporter periplasmic adaptor subunit [Anaerolineaceae bacterium]|nr:efflux RND transporter periplasmic adaptor subunit [Anaerolineaceae bacterium]
MKSSKKKRIWLISAFVILVVGSAFAWVFLKVDGDTETASEAAQPQTSRVVRGSLILSTSGTGTLVAGDQVDLSFATVGTVSQLNVEVGDQVIAGDVLAILDDLDALQVQVEEKQLALESAQKTVQDLYDNVDVSLAQAQLTLAQAKEAQANAEKNVVQAGAGRCDSATTEAYYYEYIYAQRDVNEWESYLSDGTSGYGEDFILTTLTPLRKTRDKAYNNWQYCQGYTTLEAETSQAVKEVTEAELARAQAAYDDLLAASGLDADELALALAEQENASFQLQIAENALKGAEVIAPMDGTVISISGSEGDAVSTNTFITLADLEHPNLEIYIDETDMDLLRVNSEVSVVFDAIPDRTFMGTVVQVKPMLVEVNNYDVVQGLVDLNDTQTSAGRNLLLGMQAVVEVVGGEAENVLLVPVDALCDLVNNQATVWVMNADGSFTAHSVELGLMDYSQAEVVSGLAQGDMVSLEDLE